MTTISGNEILRIGIMVDSLTVESWVEHVMEQLIQADFTKLCVVIVNNKQKETNESKRRKRAHLLYELYCKLDYKLHRSRVSINCLEKKNIERLLEKVEIYDVNPIQEGNTDSFHESDIEAIRGYKLDVIVKIGFRTLSGDILRSAQYGVWTYHSNEASGGPALFWEIYEKNIRSETKLIILTEKPGIGKTIYRSASPTIFRSLFLNRNATYWKSSEFVLRRLRDLYQKGWGYLASLDTYNEKPEYEQNNNGVPTNLQMIKFSSFIFMHQIQVRMKLLFMKELWFIAFKNKQKGKYEWIKPPAGRFYADPFIIKKGETNYIFFEDYIYSANKGVISYIEVDRANNTYSKPEVVLETPYHLSYPFLFEWQDEIYMIPETSGNNTIELYRATKFPVEWTLEKVIMDHINAVDTTIVEHNGKFWMFCNIASKGASTFDELHLFYSDSPLGEWKGHPMNPIVSNAGHARPAGNLYKKEGKLIRPSQNCLVSYGYSIIFNEVEILNETCYKEKQISEIKPNWAKKLTATHTYNSNEDFELLDGKWQSFKV